MVGRPKSTEARQDIPRKNLPLAFCLDTFGVWQYLKRKHSPLWMCYWSVVPLLSRFLNTIFLFYSVPSLPSIGHPPHHPVSQTQLLSDRTVTLVLVRHPLKSIGCGCKFYEALPLANSGCQFENISPVKVHKNLLRNIIFNVCTNEFQLVAPC